MKLTRRHAHAAVAGAVTAAAWLAGGTVADSRQVRGAALLLLALTSTVGMATAERNTALAKKTAKRVDQLVSDVHDAKTGGLQNGGTISGNLTVTGWINCQGTLDVGGALDMNNNNINRCYQVGPADGNSNLRVPGLTLTSGNIDVSGGNINNANAISHGSTQVSHPSGLNAASIGPAGDRSALGGGGTYNPDGVDRLNWLLSKLQGCNVAY